MVYDQMVKTVMVIIIRLLFSNRVIEINNYTLNSSKRRYYYSPDRFDCMGLDYKIVHRI